MSASRKEAQDGISRVLLAIWTATFESYNFVPWARAWIETEAARQMERVNKIDERLQKTGRQRDLNSLIEIPEEMEKFIRDQGQEKINAVFFESTDKRVDEMKEMLSKMFSEDGSGVYLALGSAEERATFRKFVESRLGSFTSIFHRVDTIRAREDKDKEEKKRFVAHPIDVREFLATRVKPLRKRFNEFNKHEPLKPTREDAKKMSELELDMRKAYLHLIRQTARISDQLFVISQRNLGVDSRATSSANALLSRRRAEMYQL